MKNALDFYSGSMYKIKLMSSALAYFLLKKKEAENQNQDVTCEADLLKAKAEKRYVSRRRSSAFQKSQVLISRSDQEQPKVWIQ